jgi:sec-independent protein translocase protein TatC
MPIFILFLSRMGIVTHIQLKQNRKYVLILAFVVSAILTPPDIISQVLMAVPLILLYELSIIIAKIFGKKREIQEEDTVENESTPEV